MSKLISGNKFPDASGTGDNSPWANEPSLHIPYIYNYLGVPWETQKRVRMLLDTWFTDTTLVLPGDERRRRNVCLCRFSMMGILSGYSWRADL